MTRSLKQRETLQMVGESSNYARRPLNTIIYLGDSITERGGLHGVWGNGYNALGFWCWGQTLSGHRLQVLRNAGVGGERQQ